ncbi:EamA family transporter RarD [Vibrio caribbeanicus]|uniref:EamA family transporter RarD n=1 Tax=Vibrio caribbeanicus TaxID=701175 RepID=UPI0030D96ADA
MLTQRQSTMVAGFSFVLWGLLPLYYQFLPGAVPDELLSIRLIATLPLTFILVLVIKRRAPSFTKLTRDMSSLYFTFAASITMSISWVAFTWALTTDRVIEASLGFFISPITMMLLGVFFLKEKLTFSQKLTLFFACSGLLYQVIHYQAIPFISITMAIFFTLYGWCKKKSKYSWSEGLFVEAIVLFPFALIYLIYKDQNYGLSITDAHFLDLFLYIGSAIVTLLPLIFYSIAIRQTPISTIGLMQYIEPSIQFFLAIYLFSEAFDQVKAVSFGLIWFGLSLTIIDEMRSMKSPSLDRNT